MAINEDACWFVLNSAPGKTVVMQRKLGTPKEQVVPIENGVSIADIEKALVLQYSKSEIEDSLYFLEKRGYLLVHGFGIISPRLVYSLTDAALKVIEAGRFTDEEQRAFEDAVLDVKTPGMFGMKINLGEVWRRTKKLIMRNKSD